MSTAKSLNRSARAPTPGIGDSSPGFAERFARDGAHELRTPLSVILAYAETALRKDFADPSHKRMLEKIVEQAKLLTKVLNRWLLTADVACARSQGTQADLAIGPMVRALCAMFRVRHAQKMRGVVVHSLSEEEVPFRANEGLVLGVLGGIVESAFDRARSNIRVSYRVAADELCVIVEDDRPVAAPPSGAAPDIEDAFAERLRDSESLHAVSTLSAVKTCVDAIRGHLEISPSELGGLRVETRLPSAR